MGFTFLEMLLESDSAGTPITLDASASYPRYGSEYDAAYQSRTKQEPGPATFI